LHTQIRTNVRKKKIKKTRKWRKSNPSCGNVIHKGRQKAFREAKETKHMNTVFEKGDMVRANVAEQGMTLGLFYTIMHVIENHTPAGTFVIYIISDGMEELRIRNGHMIMTLQAKVTR
jgi:hypothetical protein